MTEGKIERWHQTMKNRLLLEHDYLPGDLEAHIDLWIITALAAITNRLTTDLSPKKVAKFARRFPTKLTQGRSRYEAQAL